MDLKTWLARLESLEETQRSQLDSARQAWLATVSDEDLEKLIGVLRRAEAGGSFHDEAEFAWYQAIVASAPAGNFHTTGE